jgi:predicted permease
MGLLRHFFSRRQRFDELSESIREHIDEKVADLMDRGMTREQAEQAARREFGNVTLIEQRSREVWQWPTLESLLADTKYAFRRLSKSPGFTTVALLTLALGIGANSGIFTLLDAVLLKSLPVPDPEQLFIVKQGIHSADKSRFAYRFFDHVSHQLPDGASIAAMSWPDDFYVRIANGQPRVTQGQLVSGNYFQVFETYPVVGRLIMPADDEKLAASPVAVISYSYWQSQYASDPRVIGRKFSVNGAPFTIVGVAPRGFFGARSGTQPAFWIPLTMQSVVEYHDHYSGYGGAQPLKPWIPQNNINWLLMVVRVKSPAAISRLMTVLNQQYRSNLEAATQYLTDPEQREAMLRTRLTLEPGQRGFADLKEQFKQPLLLLMAMAAIVLLTACANIANLLLARASARQHALAIQLSIGAGRTRLIQQTLIECLLLSVGGGALGIAVAYGCATVLPRWASAGNAAIPINLSPDGRILAFGVIIAVGTGVLFGLAPALQSASVDPASVLKTGTQSISTGKTGRWPIRKMLVVAQVALSLLLLVGAGMFLKTLENYSRLDPGFDRNHLLNVQIDTHLVNYKIGDFPPLYQRLTDRIDAIPGVSSASITTCSLVAGCHDVSDVVVIDSSGRKIARGNAQVNSVALNYFSTTGIQLLRGRSFATTDDASAPKVAIVNQAFVRHYVGNQSPAGMQFSYADYESSRYQVIGVVSDARVNDIREAAPPIIYFPIAQNVGDIDGLEVRTVADPDWIAEQARQAIADVDPRIPIVKVATLNEEVKDNLTQPRLIARLTSIFGILALTLACLGLYGVMSYTMQRRTSEVGIRLALGSTRSGVLWLVVREALSLAGWGALTGLALSLAGMHMVTSFLFGLSPDDPLIIAIATGSLMLASAVAGFIPAWRAAHIEPIQALRTE